MERLPSSSDPDICVGPHAIADTLVVLPFPAGLTDRICFATRRMLERSKRATSHANAFWSKDITGENSLIVFASEYKRDDGIRNKNQLGIDLGAAQSQRRALGLDPGIIWGATCVKGCSEVFSSGWMNDVRFSLPPTHHVCSLLLRISHDQWNLLDPGDFMKCYSFLCTLAVLQPLCNNSWQAWTCKKSPNLFSPSLGER